MIGGWTGWTQVGQLRGNNGAVKAGVSNLSNLKINSSRARARTYTHIKMVGQVGQVGQVASGCGLQLSNLCPTSGKVGQ